MVSTDIGINAFADDHSLQEDFTPGGPDEATLINNSKHVLKSMHDWMNGNRLKMNYSKTEFIIPGSRQQLEKCQMKLINVCSTAVPKYIVVRFLGVWFDENLNFKHHIGVKCESALWNLWKIRNIRHLINQSTCKHPICSLVLTHLDYSNHILYGCANTLIKKLQRVQNFADSVTEALKQLHWLPIECRIQFKLLVIVLKVFNMDSSPVYLKSLINHTQRQGIVQGLWSSNTNHLLEVPYVRYKMFAWRSFSVAGPRLWNGLPKNLTELKDHKKFRKGLKTYILTHILIKYN